MAIKTATQQLEEVQAAITAVLSGQSYSIAGRSLTRADLSALNEREEQLLRRVSRERNGGIRGRLATPV